MYVYNFIYILYFVYIRLVNDLTKMEAISIYLEKPVLCKQKEFVYKVPLFIYIIKFYFR